MAISPPYEGPPISRLVSRKAALNDLYWQQKVGPSTGFEKTFVEDIWEDERFWNSQNIWGN